MAGADGKRSSKVTNTTGGCLFFIAQVGGDTLAARQPAYIGNLPLMTNFAITLLFQAVFDPVGKQDVVTLAGIRTQIEF